MHNQKVSIKNLKIECVGRKFLRCALLKTMNTFPEDLITQKDF